MKFALLALLAGAAYGQALQGEGLVTVLRSGGFVIVMRHTSSPREVPSKQAANADNRRNDDIGFGCGCGLNDRATSPRKFRPLRARTTQFGQAALKTSKIARSGDCGHARAEFYDLRGQPFRVLSGHECINLVKSSIVPDDI